LKSASCKSSVFAILGSKPAVQNCLSFLSGRRVWITLFASAAIILSALSPSYAGVHPAVFGLRLQAVPTQSSSVDAQKAPPVAAVAPPVDAGHAASTHQVVYENGLLTIVAENVPLSAILDELHTTMGTEVDLPAGSSGERLWARLGPGPARKVLSELLANTDLNYVIQASATDPAGIKSVALTLRTPDGTGGKSEPVQDAGGRGRPFPRPMVSRPPEDEAAATPAPDNAATPPSTASASTPPASPAESTPGTASASTATPAAEAPVMPNATGPSNIAPETPQPSAGSFNPHPTPPPTLTPDQVAQQLANMYQQRRQMQQTQSSSTPN
jgi:hypothetical protein